MGTRIDLKGSQFGRLLVLKFSHTNKRNVVYWNVRCDCGIVKVVSGTNLKNNSTKSCGCLQKKLLARSMQRKMTKHGMSRTPTYKSWDAMKSRCLNINNVAYSRYGGRGITICNKWMDFKNFYADMGERPKRLTLERIDNNGNYEPGNCKWATPTEQNNNAKSNVLIGHNGIVLTIAQWAVKLKARKGLLYDRLQRQEWPIKRAFVIDQVGKCTKKQSESETGELGHGL